MRPLKVIALLFCTAFFLASPALAGLFDDPAFVPPEGKPVLSLEYFRENARFSSKEGAPDVDLSSNYLYAVLSYSGADGGEVFVKAGARDATLKNFFADKSDFFGSDALSGGIGLKQSYFIGKNLKIGGLVDYMISQGFTRTKAMTVGGVPTNERIAVDSPWEVDAAIAFSYIGDWYAPYIGPYLSWQRFKAEMSSPNPAPGLPASAAAHYSQAQAAGGFVGLEVLRGDFKADVEAQVSNETSFGASISYLFE